MAITVTRLDHAIPAEDLTRQYPQIEHEVMAAVREVLPRGKYTLGPQVAAFEEEFARFCGVSYGVGISNGTEALHLALLACEVGPGDEVITVPNTYAATVFAISYVGATPIYVDVDARTFNLDPSGLEAAITPRTRAILPVHMYGQPVDMDPVLEIARRHGLRVIADAAVTSDETLYQKLRQLRYMGQKVKHEHEMLGFQQRLDELQAAILRIKL